MEIVIADKTHIKHAQTISRAIAYAAKDRGTGIAMRSPEYLTKKMEKNHAVIALDGEKFAGFCYIEKWQKGKYVAHSGLIVMPEYRGTGLGKKIKQKIFNFSIEKYPDAKIFGITTGLSVMKINTQLGYKPVHFSEITQDEEFWKGCKTCSNYDILTRTNRKMCLCTGMLYDPEKEKRKNSNDK